MTDDPNRFVTKEEALEEIRRTVFASHGLGDAPPPSKEETVPPSVVATLDTSNPYLTNSTDSRPIEEQVAELGTLSEADWDVLDETRGSEYISNLFRAFDWKQSKLEQAKLAEKKARVGAEETPSE
jgi:hypothetical protein